MNFLKYLFLFSFSIVIPIIASEEIVEEVSSVPTFQTATMYHWSTNPYLCEAFEVTEQHRQFNYAYASSKEVTSLRSVEQEILRQRFRVVNGILEDVNL